MSDAAAPAARWTAREPIPEPEWPALAAYLAPLTPICQRDVVWGNGTIPLRLTGYFCDADSPPPIEHVNSVRCVVLRGESVLAIHNEYSVHLFPGGRREPGETLLQTLERELLEETGWRVSAPRLLGVVRLRHLCPKPEPFPYPDTLYPDFLWVIYGAEAATHHPDAVHAGYPEGLPTFCPLADLPSLPVDDVSYLQFLSRALDLLRRPPADQSSCNPVADEGTRRAEETGTGRVVS